MLFACKLILHCFGASRLRSLPVPCHFCFSAPLSSEFLRYPVVPPAAKKGKGDLQIPASHRALRARCSGAAVNCTPPVAHKCTTSDGYALLGFSYYPFVSPGASRQGNVILGVVGGGVLVCEAIRMRTGYESTRNKGVTNLPTAAFPGNPNNNPDFAQIRLNLCGRNLRLFG
jgi:hypothetical protein